MRILLIEDNRRLSYELKGSLAHEGYAVDTAYDGVEGQELAESASYDALILDILLPRKDGLEVCRDLRYKRINTPICRKNLTTLSESSQAALVRLHLPLPVASSFFPASLFFSSSITLAEDSFSMSSFPAEIAAAIPEAPAPIIIML